MRKSGIGWFLGVELVVKLLKVVILMAYRLLHALSRCSLKPSVNKKFVELYLAHELSSKEFNRLYGEDMKRLGLKD
ncbi:Uncharacterised protein [Prevotella melaninogenica]|uniref:hypothetical protein n=1 Tax=Prevotella melaninogenica TaxID=28132 RepID=UPI0019568DEF|nr:hypothetical protein [Prevotella melaninogenica]VTY03290.1 Uncharacterised protein [Prevotella melaninogenica]